MNIKMNQKFIIKGHTIGEGRPIVCVPIIEKNKEDILEIANQLRFEQVQMVEWRIDWFEGYHNIESVLDILEAIHKILKDSIILCTFRSKEQGGEGEINKKNYENLLIRISESNFADIIDVEFFTLGHSKQCIKKLQTTKTLLLASEHNFGDTPSNERMIEILTMMHESYADIVKLAVMPKDGYDVLRLLEASLYIRNNHPDCRFLVMSMGSAGLITRLSGESFGSCITFGSFLKASAPGQMEMKDVSFILDKIHDNLQN